MVYNKEDDENNLNCNEVDGLCELHHPTPNRRSFIVVTITTLILLMGQPFQHHYMGYTGMNLLFHKFLSP
jgi:hypothetical protein